MLQKYGGKVTDISSMTWDEHMNFNDELSPKKNLWTNVLGYAKSNHGDSNDVRYLVILQRCKQNIKDNILSLGDINSVVLKNFDIFQNYLHKTFLASYDTKNMDITQKTEYGVYNALSRSRAYYNEMKLTAKCANKPIS